ncbi:MAG: LysR family transcriptional regulator [Shinella sp.]|uniref:LysR family transcriptional regulator n=1 Tax=Shinella sp. TaxID=1870904 RepID=UPI004036DCD2
MRISDTDLRLLRVFQAVVRSGSFAAAQNALNVTLSAVSNHIAALKQRVGYRVCQRGRAGFRLTPQGESLFLYSEQLFTSIEEFQEKAKDLKGELSGELRIGVIDNTITDPSSHSRADAGQDRRAGRRGTGFHHQRGFARIARKAS